MNGGSAFRLLVVTLVIVSGLVIGAFMARDTSALVDYRVYVEAGQALWQGDDPYSVNEGAPVDLQYRYPPLLAMVFPIVRWIWFPLVVGGIALAIARRRNGFAGRWFPAHIGGILVANVLNGNAQGLVMGIGSLAPTMQPWVGVAVAVAAWLKLYPAAIALWWLGRREWRVLAWFAVAFALLGLIQLPWLGEFIRYSRTQTDLPPQLSLRALGMVPWVAAIVALSVVTVARARTDSGWFWCVALQIVALPTALAFNIPLLLMHPTVGSMPYAPLDEPPPDPRMTLAVAAGAIALGTLVLFALL